jgi:hypothetical protein
VKEQTAVVHPLAVRGTSSSRRAERVSPAGFFAPLVGPLPHRVARISAPESTLAAAREGLPEVPAADEAVAIRLRRRGVQLVLGAPDELSDDASLVETVRARGASSVAVMRADPSLVPELQIGSWFHVSARMRAIRLVLLRLPASARALGADAALPVTLDLAFWRGVRSAATATEWRRLTRSSYVCLYYHRIAGELKPGQERLDVAVPTFERQMKLLRLLRFRPLTREEFLRFHGDSSHCLPRRSYVVTADDGFADAAAALARRLEHRPQPFVTTATVGQTATWADGEPLAGWHELRALAAGGAAVGSHGATHSPLTEAGPSELENELAGSLAELRARLRDPARNGAGVDAFCLRRIGIKEWDSGLSFLWKILTGEHVAARWERRQIRARGLAADRATVGIEGAG